MKKQLLARLAMFLFVFGLSSTSGAALIKQDLSNTGDGLLTLDSTTGLSWLNVSATVNHSYNDVISGYGGFVNTMGFRYATIAEVGQLFSEAGVLQTGNWVWGYWNFGNQGYVANSNLGALLGVTYPFDGLTAGSYGITGTTSVPGTHEYGLFLYNNHADYLALQDGGAVDDTYNVSYVGSFLVKDTNAAPVPEPSTELLVGVGMAGIAYFRKRLQFK